LERRVIGHSKAELRMDRAHSSDTDNPNFSWL
jgi:hypothetical protein